ncbi:MAG TPA: CPBP family intramembrane glutamic endopeptidase [Thermoanaerobaculia bacterium]|nr:CPBP family intramembrane glutamic endopeptidase [Thermoanaerobaculia bacterium]
MIRALIPDSVNPLGYALLVFAGIFLPILIVRSARRIGSGPLPIARVRFYKQTILFQLILAALCAWTAWTHGFLAMPLPERPLLSWSVASLLYVLTVVTLKVRWPGRNAAAKRRLYDILPHDRRELVPYVFVCIVAGVAEEIIYRGVMTALLQRIVGVAVVTIVIVSISFALAHAMQGWRSVAGIFVIALGCHALVWLAQSLVPIMVVHFAYDLTAGMLIPRWYEKSVDTPLMTA